MNYHLVKDAGEGTPISESPANPYANLMDAFQELRIELEYITEGHHDWYTGFADSRYVITQIRKEGVSIPRDWYTTFDDPDITVDVSRQVKKTIARLWIEARP